MQKTDSPTASRFSEFELFTVKPGFQPDEHSVQFYERDESLVESVREFSTTGISDGVAVALLVTAPHKTAIRSALEKDGLNVANLEKSGQLVVLDAQETLNQILVDGMPDESLFNEVIGRVISHLSQRGHGVRAFGEMVAILWSEGKRDAALQLEQLWNRLAEKHEFALLCAYPVSGFEGSSNTEPFLHVCREHSHVIPAESYAEHLTRNEQSRIIAMWQQKAAALEAEIQERKKVEAELRASQEELSAFVNNAALGLQWVGPDGTIKWANRAELQMLGYSAEEYIGRNIAEFHTDKDVIKNVLTRLANGEILRDFEAQLRCKDGSMRNVLIDSCAHWKDGKFIHTQFFTRDVTEKKKAEASLEQLVSLMPSGVYSCDADGQITFFNRRAAELWGYEPKLDELTQKFCACYKVFSLDGTFIPPEKTPMAIALKEGQSFRGIEAIVERPDGTTFTASVNIDPIRDAQGKITGAINVFQDVTERRAAQEATLQLAAIVESSEDAILALDTHGTITSWNAGAERLYGYNANEAIGKPVSLIVPENRHGEEQKILEKLRTGERIEHYETVRQHKDGSLVAISLTVSPMRNSVGQIIGVSKVARDISKRKEVEAALRQSESMFRELADSMPQIVWAAGPDGTLDYCNKKWHELNGIEKVLPSEENWLRILHPEDRERCRDAWHHSVKTGTNYEIECRFKFPGENDYRWHLGRALPIRNTDGKIIRWFGTCTDIDDQKRAEQKLENAVRERTASLQEAVEQMEEFSYSISHDIRGPLRAMQGYSHILMEDAVSELSANNLNYLRRIAQSAERLDRLVQDVLAYTRVSRLEMNISPVDLDRLLNEVLRSYVDPRTSTAEISIQRPLPAVLGHEASLVQCFANVIANALKFVPPGTVPTVRIWSQRIGNNVRIWVEDNGIGIHPDQINKIFNMFERSPEAAQYPGTGVGLAIVKKAIYRMKGKIGVESDLGKGSRFWIQLPASAL